MCEVATSVHLYWYIATPEVAWGRSFLETSFRSSEPMRGLKVAVFFFVLGFYFLATTFAVGQTAMFYIFVKFCVVEYIYLSFFILPPTK